MPSKPLKTQNPGGDLPATDPGLRPGDFGLGSAESRAVARAKVQALGKLEGPQPGDVHLDWSHYAHSPEEQGRLATIYRLVTSSKYDRIPGIPVFWITLPDWFDPETTPATH